MATTKLGNNTCIKTYLPEVWFYLIKVKSLYYKSLSHYYASIAIMCPHIERIYDSKEIQLTFDNLHNKRSLGSNRKSNLLFNSSVSTQSCYFQKQLNEQMKFYDSDILNDDKRMHLGKLRLFCIFNYMNENLIKFLNQKRELTWENRSFGKRKQLDSTAFVANSPKMTICTICCVTITTRKRIWIKKDFLFHCYLQNLKFFLLKKIFGQIHELGQLEIKRLWRRTIRRFTN